MHDVGVVDYGGGLTMAWVLDLPGCSAELPADGDPSRPLTLAIAEHGVWLRRHGRPADDDFTWRTAEIVDATRPPAEGGGGEFLFAAERTPLTLGEFARMLELLDFARADLLAELRELPAELLAWEPPVSAMGEVHEWAPEARTIGGIVEHVTQLEQYYRDGLRDGPAKGKFEAVRDMEEERAATIAMLRAMDEMALSRIHHPVHSADIGAEDWTVRKTLRRMIAHERMHTAEIRQRMAWLLVGVP